MKKKHAHKYKGEQSPTRLLLSFTVEDFVKLERATARVLREHLRNRHNPYSGSFERENARECISALRALKTYQFGEPDWIINLRKAVNSIPR